MKIVHISDTHSFHEDLVIPECDVLIHSGDISNRIGTLEELHTFLIWFEKQPAKKKIFIGGNHDLFLDPNESKKHKLAGNVFGELRSAQEYIDSIKLIEAYDVKYLCNKDYVYEGVKFYGSPYSPSFHRERWAFNADRGAEIRTIWGRIPKDVDVLITHTPVYQIFDDLKEYRRDGEDPNCGCQDLAEMIKNKLTKLKLHCSGHIHDNYGVMLQNVSNSRRVLFSNGAVITNKGKQLITHPLIITL